MADTQGIQSKNQQKNVFKPLIKNKILVIENDSGNRFTDPFMNRWSLSKGHTPFWHKT